MSSKTLSSVLEEVREMVARFEFGVWADDVRQPEADVRVALLQVGRAAFLPRGRDPWQATTPCASPPEPDFDGVLPVRVGLKFT
jgi:hypothetical protein